MSWGGNCLLQIFPLFHFPQPSVVENSTFTDCFLGKCLLKPKISSLFNAFFMTPRLQIISCPKASELPGFIHFLRVFFCVLFSPAGLSHSPAEVFPLPGQQHLLGFTWIQLSWTSQLWEPQNNRIVNKRKNPSVVLLDNSSKEKIRSTAYLKEQRSSSLFWFIESLTLQITLFKKK